MDLSKLVLINFVDKHRLADDDPNVAIQRLVRYTEDEQDVFNALSTGDEPALDSIDTPKDKKILSLTRKHWQIFDKLIDEQDVKIQVLFDAVKRYQAVKPCGFDESMEICLDMIWRTFATDDKGNITKLSDDDSDDLFDLDSDDDSISPTRH